MSNLDVVVEQNKVRLAILNQIAKITASLAAKLTLVSHNVDILNVLNSGGNQISWSSPDSEYIFVRPKTRADWLLVHSLMGKLVKGYVVLAYNSTTMVNVHLKSQDKRFEHVTVIYERSLQESDPCKVEFVTTTEAKLVCPTK